MRTLFPWMLMAIPAMAQPANCPTTADSSTSMPIYLNLQGRPGMPKGAQGGIFLNVPISPNVPSCEPVAPQPPTDVLHGSHADGNTLTGIGGGNLLRSTDPTGTVTVESIK